MSVAALPFKVGMWYALGTLASLGVGLGVLAPYIVAFGTTPVSFLHLGPLYYANFALAAIALAGVVRRSDDFVMLAGALATLGALFGLAIAARIVILGPTSVPTVYASLGWGHLVLLPSSLGLFALGFRVPRAQRTAAPAAHAI